MSCGKSGNVGSRRWVVNASPLIMLASIDRLSFLESLCADMVVPFAVAQEVHAGTMKDEAQQWLEGEGQDFILQVQELDPTILAWGLGAGESEVLAWAMHNLGYEAILDDRAARNCAVTLDIPVRGTLGVVLLAKREGLIARVRPVFDELLDAGLRIAPSVLDAALDLAGE
jgi:predicted nucleic acid-binding protein